MKISELETDNENNTANFQDEIKRKVEEIDTLKNEGEKRDVQIDEMEKQVEQLRNSLMEKDELILQSKEQEMKLEEKMKEVQEYT